jgi:methylmalonyl-CoA/ethylmalonyl-CoA epimerase
MSSNIAGIAHIGIAVSDLEQTLQLMKEAFGVEASEIRESPKDKVRGAMLDFGGTKVELIQPTSSDTAVARFIEKRGQGFHHIALHAKDSVQDRLDDLKARGFQVIDQEPRRGMFERVGFVHPKSLNGILVEFVEELEPESQPDEGHR